VRRTLAIGAGLALALAAVELGARIALRVRDRVHSGWHTRDAQRGMLQWVDERRLEQLAEEEAPPRDSMDEPSAVASPYVGVEYTAWFEDYPKEVEYFASEQGRNTFDILVLGGSVAAHLATDGDDTIQSILGGDARFRGRRIHITARTWSS
jgi:hypothetical protein